MYLEKLMQKSGFHLKKNHDLGWEQCYIFTELMHEICTDAYKANRRQAKLGLRNQG